MKTPRGAVAIDHAAVFAAEKARVEALGFQVIVTHQNDYDYNGESDEWIMTCVCVELRIQTANNWAILPTVGRASLSGIQSDSKQSYFDEVTLELLREALDDARKTYEALSTAFGFKLAKESK